MPEGELPGRRLPTGLGTRGHEMRVTRERWPLALRRDRLRLLRLAVVLEELLLSGVGERMVEELLQDGERHRRDVGTGERGLRDVHRTPDRGREDLGGDLLLAIGGDDIRDDTHAVLVDVVETAGEWTDDVRPDRRGEQRLVHREAQRDVD